MPIELSWKDDAKTILFVQFVDEWTWEDYKLAFENARLMVKDIDHHFVQLLDMRQSKVISSGAASQHILRARRSTFSEHVGITVIVGAETRIRVVLDVFEKSSGRAYPKRYLVESLDEAMSAIEDYFAKHKSPKNEAL
jgi:uncharacterized membrane protein YoaK (UPF0700 family)